MGKVIKLTALLCLLSLSLFAQNDKAAIEKQIDGLFADWNSHAFKNMSNYTTDDVEWINIVGMRWKGRQEVQMAHQAIFDAMFKKVPFRKEELTIRMLTDEVAIAYLVCHVGEFFPPDGMDHGGNKMPEADNALTLVYVKKGGKWLLTSGQNTVVDARAKESDPAKK